MQVKRIFLASSKELSGDREAFERMLARLNPQWRARDLTFDLVVWDNFIDAMSKDGLQKEYTKAAENCDVFVMLFFTKVGPHTLEEFEKTFAKLEVGAGPKVYTYFKNDFILTGELNESVKSLLEFKGRLQELKHYPTHYRNTDDLLFQFSRQLEFLYGGDATSSGEITDATPQSKIGEFALVMSYRQMFGEAGGEGVDPARLTSVLKRASRQVRTAILNMAQDLRRESWFADKHRMERMIPVFEALVSADPLWHAPLGNLGYALKDKYAPDLARALECLTRAAQLRGDRTGEGLFYEYSRALCLIQMDPAFPRKAATKSTRDAVLEPLRHARRELDATWDQVIEFADSADIRTWLVLNGSPRLK